MQLTILGHTPPGLTFEGRQPVWLAVQHGQALVQGVPGDSPEPRFELALVPKTDRDGSPDWGGPFVHGKRGDRFAYLVWYVKGEGGEARFRRAKLPLTPLLGATGPTARVHVALTDARGGPICASLKPIHLRWE